MHEHVVLGEHLFTRGKLLKFLDDTHSIHKVDIASHGNTHINLAHTIRAIGHDVDASRKSKVLRIVGSKVHLYATILIIYHERIDDEVAIKTNGRFRRDRARKGILQKAYFVFVDIHIGEAVLEHGIDNVARIEQFVNTIGTLTEDEFPRFVTHLHVVFEEGELFELSLLKDFVGYLVKCESNLRILVYAVIVVMV